jgi:hypothetical protein
MTINEARIYLRENWKRLPKTLDSKFAYYSDVKKTLELYARILKTSKNQSQLTTTKSNVIMIVQALQDETQWNKPQPRLNAYQNKYF